MFDEGGARHRIKTTNFAEVYNCVLRGSRPLPLMGIISSLCIIQCNIFTKGARQRMWFWGTLKWCTTLEWLSIWRRLKEKHFFTRSERSPTTSLLRMKLHEVECKEKMHLGPSREKTQQVCELGNQICRCSCRKPQLLLIRCSHVIVVCYALQNFSHRRYIPWYYNMETVWNTWNQIIEGYLM
jgi:hypothetical protein